ncbi:MAG: isoleucine--tRNA ligase [Candidatus Limnocylindria bacterium]
MVEEQTRFTPVGSSVDLPELEHVVLDLWRDEHSFDALRRKNAGGPRFSFIDGPITANVEAMGIHHAWNRTYKDVYQRYKAMRGFDQRYQNGFDCQGLWVEVQVERELELNSKRDIESYGIDRFSEACRARVDRSAAAITKQSVRLGQWMDWDNSYFTYDDENISHIWHVLKNCHEKGWLYKGHRSMPWCARCGTALSQHEMIDAYREMTHLSVYVRFPVVRSGPAVPAPNEPQPKESFLVWTTTPWTLPANVALAVHPELDYVRAQVADEVIIVSKKVYESAGWPDARVLETVKGRELVALHFRGPFDELPAVRDALDHHRVIAWKDVGEEEGTGIVHIAPGCGAEDFALSKTEDLPVLIPIDDQARFRAGYGGLDGKDARDVAQEIADDLERKGILFRAAPYTHRYPECWRCHEEIVFRVDDEWFISMEELRPRLIEAARAVSWIPRAAGRRMENWLTNMGDWNISRKRYWGLPLPFYDCANGHFFVLGSGAELRERATAGVAGLRELHRPWIDDVVVACPECGASATRVKEVGDCWLDAGIVPFSTLHWLDDRPHWEKWFPADYIVEMVEQVRLWFYSQLFMSVVLTGRAPYETCMAFERVLAAPGEEFHKTGQNMKDLGQACEDIGADVIRWLYARQDIRENVYWGQAPTSDIKRRLLVLWNAYSFFVTYANLDRFDPAATPVPVAERPAIDRWLLSSLARLVRECRDALDRYDSQTAALRLEAFWDELSTWYVRLTRPRFWRAEDERDSLAAYQTLYEALVTIARLFAPMLPFLAESMYQNLVRRALPDAAASVHHTDYPALRPELVDEALDREMRAAMRVVSLGRTARGEAKVKLRMPLRRLVVVFDRTDRDRDALDPGGEVACLVRDELNVKELEVREDATGLVELRVKPELKALGPKLGKDLPRVRAALAEGRFTQRDGAFEVEGFTLQPNEVLVEQVGAPGHAVGRDAGAVAALETALSPDLVMEGLARELVHKINELRKEAGLEIADRIVLRYAGAIAPTVRKFDQLISRETLAVAAREGTVGAGHRWSGELNGVAASLELERT